MASISNVVVIQIIKGARQVPLAGFGVPLVMGASNRFVELVRAYTAVEDLLTDGFLTSDPEYIAATKFMSQSVQPTQFLVGKYTAPIAQISNVTITTVVDSFLYSVTINGTVCSFLSDGSATGAEIQAGLIAAINASAQAPYVTASAGAGTSVNITSDEAGLGFSIAVGTNLAFTTPTANHSIVDDIVSLQAVSDAWYGLCLASHLSADIRQVAGYIETQKKIFVTVSSEAGIITTSTTDIASQLQDLAYERTALLYNADPADAADAAWLGRMLPTGVGSATWKFKQLVGIVADNLTQTQINNAQLKSANLYVPIGGVDITTEGVAASGEYIDVVRFIDWLQATMEARIYGLLINTDKTPYTNKGIATIENAIRAVLGEGVANGGLSTDVAPTVTVPDAITVSSVDKAARILNNVVFTGTLAGAIHKVSVKGYVSV